MTSQTGQKIITIDVLSNISRYNGNQAMKFSQLIKYIVKKYFSKKIMQ